VFTVKQLSSLAGVTPRTLRHYDDLGILKPSRIGANGYRYYGEDALLKLQQILFYRELDFPLEEIGKILGDCDFDLLGALQNHRAALQRKAARLEQLLVTVDDTIQHIKGEKLMSQKGLFKGFSDEEQDKLAQEAGRIYDPATVRESNRKWKRYSPEKKEAILAEGNQIYLEMVAVMPKGATSAEAQALVERWRSHMDYFWTPSLEQLPGLAEMYNDDPRFKANLDSMHPQLAEFMRDAVKFYVAKK